MGKYTLGEFEEVVMLTVAILYENAYGITIKEEIEKRLDRKVSVGAMRTALSRLEKKKFLKSEFGESTAVRGGKRKRYFKVTPEGKEEETVTRLSRVGFDGTIGYLKGGFSAWQSADKDTDTITSVPAEEVVKQIGEHARPVFDVRKDGEFQSEHVENAHHTSLDVLNTHLAKFPSDDTFYVHCAGGYRSVIAASILKSRGIHNLIDVAGGFGALKKAGAKVTDYVCPTTL